MISYLENELEKKRRALSVYVLGIVRDAAIADDLTQETLLRAHRSAQTLREEKRFDSWLYRIATNVCLDYLRQKKRLREDVPDSRDEAISLSELRDENAPQLNEVMECAEMGECVQHYFDELSSSYKMVILLHDVEGLTNREIAEILDVSIDVAKIRLHRARKQLRKILEDVCHFSTDDRGVLVCEPKLGRNVQRNRMNK